MKKFRATITQDLFKDFWISFEAEDEEDAARIADIKFRDFSANVGRSLWEGGTVYKGFVTFDPDCGLEELNEDQDHNDQQHRDNLGLGSGEK